MKFKNVYTRIDFFLVEISRGNAYIGYNGATCYGEKANWTDIFGGRDNQKADVTHKPGTTCAALDGEIHVSYICTRNI